MSTTISVATATATATSVETAQAIQPARSTPSTSAVILIASRVWAAWDGVERVVQDGLGRGDGLDGGLHGRLDRVGVS